MRRLILLGINFIFFVLLVCGNFSFSQSLLSVEEATVIANQKAQALVGRSVGWREVKTLTVNGQPLLFEFISQENAFQDEDSPILEIFIDRRNGNIWEIDYFPSPRIESSSGDTGNYITEPELKAISLQLAANIGMPVEEDWVIDETEIIAGEGTVNDALFSAHKVINGFYVADDALHVTLDSVTREIESFDYERFPIEGEIPQPVYSLEECIQKALAQLGELANFPTYVELARPSLSLWMPVTVPLEKPTLLRETQLLGYYYNPQIVWVFKIRVILPPELAFGWVDEKMRTKHYMVEINALTGEVLHFSEMTSGPIVDKKKLKEYLGHHKTHKRSEEIKVLIKERVEFHQKPIKCINRKGRIFLLADDLHLLGLKFDKSKFILQAGEKREKVEKDEIMNEKGKLYISARKVADLGKFNLTYNPKFKILKIERKIEKQGNK
jgi:hypothetical protein